jgi:hypothetical protein
MCIANYLLLAASLVACRPAASLEPAAHPEAPVADLSGTWNFWPTSPVLQHSCSHRESFMVVEQQGSTVSTSWIAGGPVQGARHLDEQEDRETTKGTMEGAHVMLRGQATGGLAGHFDTGEVSYELVYDSEAVQLVGQRNGRQVTLQRVMIEEPDPLECGPDPE